MGLFDKLFSSSKREEPVTESKPQVVEEKKSKEADWKNKPEELDETDKCPHCHKKLAKIPTRKKKCEFCRGYIYVRTRPSDRQKVLVTEEQVAELDKQWAEAHIINKWFRTLHQFDVTEKDYQKVEEQLSKQFGFKAKPNDVIWSIFNELITKQKDWHSLKMIYYNMALFLNDEGKDSFDMLAEAARCELMRYKERGNNVKLEISYVKGQSCPECQNMDGKVFTVDEALEIMPLPNRKCTFRFSEDKSPFCRCMYVRKFNFDE